MGRPRKITTEKIGNTDDLFHILMEYGREQFVGKGKTIYEAFEDLEKPAKLYKTAVIVIRHKENKVAKVLPLAMLKRIISHKATQSSWLKLFEKL